MLFGEDLFLEGALMSWGTCSWNHYEAEAYTFLDSFSKPRKTVFTDRRPVLQLVKQNVATNCPNQNTKVLELDWVNKEHWQQVKSQCGDAFDIILMSDLLYTSTAASKVKDTLLFFSKPGDSERSRFRSTRFRGVGLKFLRKLKVGVVVSGLCTRDRH